MFLPSREGTPECSLSLQLQGEHTSLSLQRTEGQGKEGSLPQGPYRLRTRKEEGTLQEGSFTWRTKSSSVLTFKGRDTWMFPISTATRGTHFPLLTEDWRTHTRKERPSLPSREQGQALERRTSLIQTRQVLKCFLSLQTQGGDTKL